METIEEVLEELNNLEKENEFQDKSILDELLKEIDSDVGAEEFKLLVQELTLVAPQVKNNDMQKVFFDKNYLFSINDGCGLGRHLSQLARLVQYLGLQGSHSSKFSCYRLNLPKSGSDDPCEEMISTVERKGSREHICIDISDWMNDLRNPSFKRLLMKIAEECDKCMVVFVVPFVDKEVLHKVLRSLNDILSVRPVSFAPYTVEQLDAIAAKQLSEYGFEMEQSAWRYFNERLREESADGRFYGEDTVSKTVNELLYSKLLSNAQNGAEGKLLTESDAEKLCKRSFDDDKSGMEMLDSLVGTEKIRESVLEIISQIQLSRQNGMGNPCIHMKFVGNPGTGKTTVARIIGKILKEKNILRVGEFFEHNGRDFCGRYIGETAPKTLGICREAYGSVLFIDEAYSLFRGPDDTRDFGREALDTLISEMENHRSDMLVIMAGYTEDMARLMNGNAGLESRIPYTLEFPNFSREQLFEIFVQMSANKLDMEEGLLSDVRDYLANLDKNFVNSKSFSNARYIRNLYERLCAKAAMRCQLAGEGKLTLLREDFARAVMDSEFANTTPKTRRIGFGN